MLSLSSEIYLKKQTKMNFTSIQKQKEHFYNYNRELIFYLFFLHEVGGVVFIWPKKTLKKQKKLEKKTKKLLFNFFRGGVVVF